VLKCLFGEGCVVDDAYPEPAEEARQAAVLKNPGTHAHLVGGRVCRTKKRPMICDRFVFNSL